MPVPFSNIGTPLLNLLPAENRTVILRDIAAQLSRYYEKYRAMKNNRPPPLSLSSISEEDVQQFAHQILRTVDNRHIRYPLCYLGAVLMAIPFFFGQLAQVALDAIRSPRRFPSSLTAAICVVLTVNCFTSYTLITHPALHPLFLSVVFAVYQAVKQHCLSFVVLLIPLLISCYPTSSPLLVVLLFGVVILTRQKRTSATLMILHIAVESWYLLQPSPPSSTPALLALFLAVAQRGSADSLVALFLLLTGTRYASALLCLLCVYYVLDSLPSSIVNSYLSVLISLHFTYLVTPVLSFSSIRWSSAFVFTHKTNVVVQAVSVASLTFHPFIIACRTRQKEGIKEGIKLIVLSSAVSLLINTTSPVVWSDFAPLFLFTVVLWIVSFAFFSVCVKPYILYGTR